MIYGSVTCVSIIYLIIAITGCSLAGLGERATDRGPRMGVADQPGNAYYHFFEAHLSLKKGQVDRAIEIMQQARVLDPESAYLRRELASLWLMKKDTTQALELLNGILADYPEDVESLVLAGRIHQNMNNQKKAIDAY